ncbi:MAG: antibiotic biosynthesis monooxygenase [Lutibacter sp.]
MYAHIVSFLVKEGEGISFIEMQKFEEITEAKPAGLDHFHVFKDKKNPLKYYLIEYWNSIDDKQKMEASKEHQLFHELRDIVISKKVETFECDVIL